jgi:uncharacterized repeat protein (TIGR01451 family)
VDVIAAGNLVSHAAGTASPTNGIAGGSALAPAGGTVTTDLDGDGATIEDPLEVSVTTPTGGTVSITKTSSFNYQGSHVGGRAFTLEAPTATVADPLVITFLLDVSVFPLTWDVNTAYAYVDGLPISTSCTGPGASPDPCIASRTRLANDDVEVVVRSSHASEWAVLVAAPTADAGGPYQAVEDSSVQLSGSATGGTSPYGFLWSSAAPLSDPVAANPTVDPVDDGTFPLSLTVIDANGLVGLDDTELTVTNADPEVGALQLTPSSPVQTGTAVTAEAAFTDPGLADTHTATIDWGDGSPTGATVNEADGSGTASGSHSYATPGTYTVTLTVEDDDGGQDQVTAQVTVLGGVPIELTKTASRTQTAVGSSVRYTLTIRNPGSATVTITALTDDRPLPSACTSLVGRTITPGASRRCNYTVTLTSAGEATNTASVAVRNAQGQTGTATATATVTATKAGPKLTVTALPATGALGTALHARATLSGGYLPEGTLTFRLYGPSQTTCSGTPQHTEAVEAGGAGTYTTGSGFTANVRGIWRWTVEYSGDDNNSARATACNGARVRIT